MTSPDETQKPFQFGLRSIFLATAAVGVAFGLLKWLGLLALILAVQFSAVVAVLVLTKGTAWRGVVIGGSLAAVFILLFPPRIELLHTIALWASLLAWLGGGFAADTKAKRRSHFLRWTWLLVSVWLLILRVTFFD
jgi:hypothetical protein